MARSSPRPTGWSRTARYGPDNLLSEVLYTEPGGTATIDAIALEYDAFGMRRRMHFGVATVDYEHDYNGSLMRATWRNGQSGFLAEGWDDAGRLTRYSVFPGEGAAEITSLAYDNRDQLVMEGTRRYGYDEAGNRVRMSEGTTVTTHTFVRAANGALSDRIHEVRRAMQVGLPTYRYHTYDAAGWLVRDTVWQGGSNWRHVYDAAGQLHTHSWIDPVSPQYRYDGLGRMVNRRQPGEQLVPTWYDGVNSAFHSSNTEYIGTPGVDEQLVVIRESLTCYTVTAGPRMLGMVTSLGLPCGDSTAVHASGGIVRSHSFDLARAKEPLDGESAGLSFFRNRWYDPRTGRFTQEDPIGYSGGQNLYAYAGNNPASYTDPFGLCPEEDRDANGLCPGGLTAAQWRDVENAAARLVRLSEGLSRKPEFGLFIIGTSWGEGYADFTVYGGGSNRKIAGTAWGGGDLPASTPAGAVAFVHSHPYGVTAGGGRYPTSLQPSPADAANARIRGIPVFSASINGMMLVLPDGTIPTKTWPLGGVR